MTVQSPAGAARKFLERTGLEPTLNRILVLSAVADSRYPLTAREVYTTVLREHRLNRVTVYRILDLLAENGVVNRISSGERALHFCVGADHSHFHCTRCGKVQCVANTLLQFDEKAVARALGMTVSSIDLHLEGLCAECEGSRAVE
ncbi:MULTISPECIES: Fur family transcriptional regulator [unclassified Pseudodesulfovibrio]|uniref:Fur family transcriptional regulator n=1 Tax=unclassified Pseudodesulfovibrio TaxID=2661612 RepID=UPI000FEBCE0B|nr:MULTISPECIES: Fur family transcriptional regulator [unclassified Pseudodesulfovibrio]MCJ2164317.1 transcriptional repressor [Pseudodesulfovibrio sp. S3-i]RWU04527.1 transcriptional repressor [Pseudodesulfovibrio sp. S3]